MHSIVNLYSSPRPLVTQVNTSFLKVSDLPFPRLNNFQNSHPLFLLTPLFWGYLNSQVRINKIVNGPDYHPCPSRLTSRVHPFIFHITYEALSLSRMLAAFSLKLLYSTMCGKNFQIYGVYISRKWIDSRHFRIPTGSQKGPMKQGLSMLLSFHRSVCLGVFLNSSYKYKSYNCRYKSLVFFWIFSWY